MRTYLYADFLGEYKDAYMVWAQAQDVKCLSRKNIGSEATHLRFMAGTPLVTHLPVVPYPAQLAAGECLVACWRDGANTMPRMSDPDERKAALAKRAYTLCEESNAACNSILAMCKEGKPLADAPCELVEKSYQVFGPNTQLASQQTYNAIGLRKREGANLLDPKCADPSGKRGEGNALPDHFELAGTSFSIGALICACLIGADAAAQMFMPGSTAYRDKLAEFLATRPDFRAMLSKYSMLIFRYFQDKSSRHLNAAEGSIRTAALPVAPATAAGLTTLLVQQSILVLLLRVHKFHELPSGKDATRSTDLTRHMRERVHEGASKHAWIDAINVCVNVIKCEQVVATNRTSRVLDNDNKRGLECVEVSDVSGDQVQGLLAQDKSHLSSTHNGRSYKHKDTLAAVQIGAGDESVRRANFHLSGMIVRIKGAEDRALPRTMVHLPTILSNAIYGDVVIPQRSARESVIDNIAGVLADAAARLPGKHEPAPNDMPAARHSALMDLVKGAAVQYEPVQLAAAHGALAGCGITDTVVKRLPPNLAITSTAARLYDLDAYLRDNPTRKLTGWGADKRAHLCTGLPQQVGDAGQLPSVPQESLHLSVGGGESGSARAAPMSPQPQVRC